MRRPSLVDNVGRLQVGRREDVDHPRDSN
jgi:hypothetical protein